MNNTNNTARQIETVNAPVIGEGCTIQIGSDAYCATVIEISASGKSCKIQRDRSVMTNAKDAQMGATQMYIHASDTKGEIETVRMTKNGWRIQGSRHQFVTFGVRRARYDYSF